MQTMNKIRGPIGEDIQSKVAAACAELKSTTRAQPAQKIWPRGQVDFTIDDTEECKQHLVKCLDATILVSIFKWWEGGYSCTFPHNRAFADPIKLHFRCGDFIDDLARKRRMQEANFSTPSKINWREKVIGAMRKTVMRAAVDDMLEGDNLTTKVPLSQICSVTGIKNCHHEIRYATSASRCWLLLFLASLFIRTATCFIAKDVRLDYINLTDRWWRLQLKFKAA